ncbi:MAG: algG [Moraxellaceae bacterium]|nr:algG [Moraxellaceae bacterium]
MRWYSLMCCVMWSPFALADQATKPLPLAHDGYRLRELPAAPLPRQWAREKGNLATDCAVVPPAPASKPGDLEVVPLVKDRFFNKFFQGGGRLLRLVTQQQGVPRAVIIRSGTWTLPRLAQALAAEEGILKRQGQTYLLRVPLLLHSGAGIVVAEGESLRLSRDRGSFLISMGSLHIRKARLEGWDESQDRPAVVEEGGRDFQPFLVSWSGSQTVISESTVAGLGFAENLAQGVTLAVGPQGLADYALPPPARAVVQGNHFEGMYSALHATGIPDLQVCRNQFLESRLHAIHLDEGSSGLIARNHITATMGAYGIYLNKGASGVRILDNDISENRRNGISISDSTAIILAGNEIRQNFDAVFLQNADQVLMADNHILDNQRHGVSLRNVGRIRFQGDRIGPNRGVGILAQPGAKTMSRTAGAASANLAVAGLSPASPPRKAVDAGGFKDASLTTAAGEAKNSAGDEKADSAMAWRPSVQKLEILDVVLEGNHSSALVVERPYAIVMDSVDVMYPGVRRRPVFRGVLNAFESDILQRLSRKKSLVVEPDGKTESPGKTKYVKNHAGITSGGGRGMQKDVRVIKSPEKAAE